jgi:hypothetical protein
MTDIKEDPHLSTTSSHLENLSEADERGVASVPDLKPVAEEDVNDPQVGCWDAELSGSSLFAFLVANLL